MNESDQELVSGKEDAELDQEVISGEETEKVFSDEEVEESRLQEAFF